MTISIDKSILSKDEPLAFLPLAVSNLKTGLKDQSSRIHQMHHLQSPEGES